jgi:very-short-patch-repair endonuclease
VFFTTDRPTREGRWFAAVRRCGSSALLSFWSAAVLWRLVDLAAPYDDATSAQLKRVLETYVAGRGLTDSELEALFFDLVATRTTLPTPQTQRTKPGGRVDFFWPQFNLIAEVDGWDSHRGKVAFHEDRRRDRANKRRGLDTVRFTWDDVVLTPREVAADLEFAAALAA